MVSLLMELYGGVGKKTRRKANLISEMERASAEFVISRQESLSSSKSPLGGKELQEAEWYWQGCTR